MSQQLRVRCKDAPGMTGIVLDQRDGKTHVLWGYIDRKSVDAWMSDEDLEPLMEPVYAGDPETRQKAKVYDPEESMWAPMLKLPVKTVPRRRPGPKANGKRNGAGSQ